MNCQEIKNLIDTKHAQLIDVREPLEFAFGHVKGAKNIPLSKLSAKIGYFKQSDQPYILYCASGNRSGQATEFLKAHGLNLVYNAGGIGDVKSCMKSK